MIAIDTDLLYKTQYSQLNTKRTNSYAYNSIDSRTDQEVDETTDNSATQLNALDIDEVVRGLNLESTQNKFSVLMLLSHEELVKLLSNLKNDKLIVGLKFFNKKRLLNIIGNLKKQDILKIALKIYSKKELSKKLSLKGLQAFMDSPKITPNELAKAMKILPKNILTQLMESITGKPAGNQSQEELIKGLMSLKPEQLRDGLKYNLPTDQLAKLVGKLCENNEELYKEIPAWALMEPLMKETKLTLIDGMQALEQDKLIKILDELPNTLLAVVDTQVEPDKIAELLQQYHPNLLSSM
jgi:hypothetical protein